jgi:hypothetical protein
MQQEAPRLGHTSYLQLEGIASRYRRQPATLPIPIRTDLRVIYAYRLRW